MGQNCQLRSVNFILIISSSEVESGGARQILAPVTFVSGYHALVSDVVEKIEVGIEKVNHDAVDTSSKNHKLSRKRSTRSTSDTTMHHCCGGANLGTGWENAPPVYMRKNSLLFVIKIATILRCIPSVVCFTSENKNTRCTWQAYSAWWIRFFIVTVAVVVMMSVTDTLAVEK